MKTRIARYLLPIAGLAMLVGAPAFAQDRGYDGRDLRHDYQRMDRMNDDMRHDYRERDRALYYGDYGRAARIQRDINRDRDARRDQWRDIRRDQYRDYDRYGYGWR